MGQLKGNPHISITITVNEIFLTDDDLDFMTLVMMSTGTGKTIVLLFSAEMLFNV